MAETFWLALAPAWAGGLVLSWALEALLRPPVQPPWRRPAWMLLLHAGVWTLLFALELALFRRPYFGAINVLAIEAVLVLVSAAKARVLREPFVYSDFEYFTDALRHPRLYLPFLGWPAALLLACGYGLALWAGLALESSATGARTAAWAAHAAPAPFWGATLALAAAGAALAVLAGHRDAGLTYEADQDLRRLGLVATLWLYGRAERQPWTPAMRSGPFGAAPAAAGAGPLPHLVSVQSESFFDARRVFGTLKPEVLAGLDALRAEALEHGQLEVAAWGANTVRTEFAFLTGLAASALGVHRYNPYRRLRQPQPSLASHLRQRGYRTVCVHPFHASFYGRDRVMPWLGFDEFVHLDAFADAPRAGLCGRRGAGAPWPSGWPGRAASRCTCMSSPWRTMVRCIGKASTRPTPRRCWTGRLRLAAPTWWRMRGICAMPTPCSPDWRRPCAACRARQACACMATMCPSWPRCTGAWASRTAVPIT